jgi:ankyrin repeat protein
MILIRNMHWTECVHLSCDQILANGVDIHEIDHCGNTLLHLAAQTDNVEAVKFCLKQSINVNAQNFFNQTPLHCSSTSEVAEILLQHRPDLNLISQSGFNTTMKEEMIKTLDDHGVPMSLVDERGWTHIHSFALSNNPVEKLEKCKKLGLDLNVSTQNGWNPFLLVLCNLKIEQFRYEKIKNVFLLKTIQIPEELKSNELLVQVYNQVTSCNHSLSIPGSFEPDWTAKEFKFLLDMILFAFWTNSSCKNHKIATYIIKVLDKMATPPDVETLLLEFFIVDLVFSKLEGSLHNLTINIYLKV